MRLYAQRPDLRLRQALGDTGVLAWIVLWVLVARAVHRAVLVLAEPGQAVEDLGGSVARNMSSAAETADRVPVAGDALAKPFQALGDAGDSVSGAGQAAQSAVGTLAFWLAVVFVVLPVGWLLVRWMPGRWRYAREAGAAARLLRGTPDLELFAVRALAPGAGAAGRRAPRPRGGGGRPAAARPAGPGAVRRPGAAPRPPPPARGSARRHRRRVARGRPDRGACARGARAGPAGPAAA